MLSNTGYSLSDAGYDVWLFNARGTGLSRTYSIYSKAGTAPRMNKMSWDFRYMILRLFTNLVKSGIRNFSSIKYIGFTDIDKLCRLNYFIFLPI